jgi:O-acetyl-ADP-ribose deacetylase (regulator of RNase III)
MDTPTALIRINETNVMAVHGDLTRQPVAAVVNAANDSLQHGGGVAQAIVRTGGRVIQEESDAWIRENGPVQRGQAAVTTGGMLVASHVIHVVGPIYDESQDNAAMLADATHAALDAATAHSLTSIAFPAISAGIYGYPAEAATAVIVAAVRSWLENNDSELAEVRLVGFSRDVAGMFAAALTGEDYSPG